mgnify:CR=1 FL=1
MDCSSALFKTDYNVFYHQKSSSIKLPLTYQTSQIGIYYPLIAYCEEDNNLQIIGKDLRK